MRDAYFGNNKISINQRRYLGAKTRLLGFIDDIIQKEGLAFDTFADVFAGTGVVANHFLGRADIIVNDILASNTCIYRAFFGKERIREKKLLDLLDKYNNLDISTLNKNYFSINFSDTYFSAYNAKKIGFIREDIENLYINKQITSREKDYLLTSLLYAMDRIANTVGHYDAFRKVDMPHKSLDLCPLYINKSNHKAQIFQSDANELAKKIKADIVYIDPPYNSRQYSDAYHLLENITTWEQKPVVGIAKKMDRSHIKSKYNMKEAGLAFCELISNINAKYILVSYNDMGASGNARSQACISDHEILSALKLKGNVSIYETDFKQFTTGKSNNKKLKERIFLCRVADSSHTKNIVSASKHNPIKKGYIKSPLNYTGGKHRLLPQITKFFPRDINTFYDVFAGGANVGINADAKKIIGIEGNGHVASLLQLIQKSNFESLNNKILEIVERYKLSQSYIRGYDFYGANSSAGLGQYNKNSFLQLRKAFNYDKTQTLLLLVLILYSFNNQIRFNSKGEFNLPVGKRDYNGNSRKNIAAFNQAANEKNIEFITADFRDIENLNISPKDFIYLDPPYLLGVASYNEMGGWTKQDEMDLYAMLSRLNARGIRFALSNVLNHKGQKNIILHDCAAKNDFTIHYLNYNYSNSNYQTTAKDNNTDEILVTNY